MDNDVLERKEEIIDLIKNQSKAKIDWVATILQIDVDELRMYAPELGLELNEDILSMPISKEEKLQTNIESTMTQTPSIRNQYKTQTHSSFNITRKQVVSSLCIVCSLSITGVSIWMMTISLMILIPYWRSEYSGGFFNSFFATEYYMLFFGFLMLLGSIVSVIFFIVRIQK